MVSESAILEALRAEEVRLPPLTLRLQSADGVAREWDAMLEATWRRNAYRFVVEIKRYATPKLFQQTISWLRTAPRPSRTYPLLMVPFLSPEQLTELEECDLSGIDLSGNGIVTVPDKILIFRTGRPNKYPQSAPIKNVYRGASSLIGRTLLLRPSFPDSTALRTELLNRGGSISPATVSKVIKALEEDLVVSRKGRSVGLIQPDKLLDRLSDEYRSPRIKRRFTGQATQDVEGLLAGLVSAVQSGPTRLVLTGAYSSLRYSSMAREDTRSFYCTSLDAVLQSLGPLVQESTSFPDIELLETEDETVYFDIRQVEQMPWASPVQSYLELMAGDKRDRHTAAALRDGILIQTSDPRENRDNGR
jgi:hypothetical protein